MKAYKVHLKRKDGSLIKSYLFSSKEEIDKHFEDLQVFYKGELDEIWLEEVNIISKTKIPSLQSMIQDIDEMDGIID